MINIGPQRSNVNNTVQLVNSSFKESRVHSPPVFNTLNKKESRDKEIEEAEKLQEKARQYRKQKMYKTDGPPLKTGPIRILRFQLRTLEEEIAEYQLRLREQRSIEKL